MLAVMLRFMRAAVFMFLGFAAAFAQNKPEWDNPAIVHIGTEKPHATMMVYPSSELARTGDRAKSPWFQSLNGTWKFRGSVRPVGPAGGFLPDRLRRFGDGVPMPVPASWQMHGFDIPIYTNIIYPFPQDASKAPAPPYDFQSGGQLPAALHRAARLGKAARSICISTAWIRPSTHG